MSRWTARTGSRLVAVAVLALFLACTLARHEAPETLGPADYQLCYLGSVSPYSAGAKVCQLGLVYTYFSDT